MTLKEAVQILNDKKHRGVEGGGLKGWIVSATQVIGDEPVRVVSNQVDCSLTAFEVIAIAEKYAAGGTPASVMEQVAKEVEIYDE